LDLEESIGASKTNSKKSSSIFPYRGKWRIQYLDLQGKVRTKTASTKEDAYKQLGTLEHLKASGELPRRAA
jgi:hypothetical protein